MLFPVRRAIIYIKLSLLALKANKKRWQCISHLRVSKLLQLYNYGDLVSDTFLSTSFTCLVLIPCSARILPTRFTSLKRPANARFLFMTPSWPTSPELSFTAAIRVAIKLKIFNRLAAIVGGSSWPLPEINEMENPYYEQNPLKGPPLAGHWQI